MRPGLMRFVVVAAVVLALATCGGERVEQVVGPATAVFSDDATCLAVGGPTGEPYPCDYVNCDVVPEGSTFDETCGPYFQDGLAHDTLDDAGIRRVLAESEGCLRPHPSGDDIVWLHFADGGWISVAGPDGLRATVVERYPACA